MIALIIIAILLAVFAYFDPYIDITEDMVLLWYNKKKTREYIVLWEN